MEQKPDWTLNPVICRCCLSNSGSWDLTKSYVSPGPTKEILAELLRDCFGISLSYLSHEGVSQRICGRCIVQLRNANHFRNQVQAAERKFTEYINKEDSKEGIILPPVVVKLEEVFDNDDASECSSSVSVKAENCSFEAEDAAVTKIPETQKKSSVVIIRRVLNKKTAQKVNEPVNEPKVHENTESQKTGPIVIIRREPDKKKTPELHDLVNEAKLLEPVNKSALPNPVNKLDLRNPINKPELFGPGSWFWKREHSDTVNEQPTTQKKKRIMRHVELYQYMRHNTALILHNSTVMPFRSRKNTHGRYTCFYCEENFFKIQEMRKHVDETHANITEEDIIKVLKRPVFVLTKAEFSSFCCKICNQDQKDIDHLIRHLVDIHEKTYHDLDFKPSHGILGYILETENPTCYECHKEFPFFQALVTHVNGTHISNFDCDKCDKKFLLKNDIDRHMIHCHDEQKIARYTCKFCKEKFTKISAKAIHMKKTHGFGRLKCRECGEEFSDFKQRNRHLVKVHNHRERFFKCNVCPKQFLSTSELGNHRRRVHAGNKLTCDICEKKLSSKVGLQAHLRIHSGEKPYACQFCEKLFRSPSSLHIHERIHTNDKRYVCEVCDAAFIQSHSLKQHYTSRHPDCGIDLKRIHTKKSN